MNFDLSCSIARAVPGQGAGGAIAPGRCNTTGGRYQKKIDRNCFKNIANNLKKNV